MELKHCPTQQMIADYFAKPLQGLLYRKMRDIIMDVTPFLVKERIEKETKIYRNTM